MGSISRQVFFEAPIEKVWSIWADVEKTPDWVDGVKASKIISQRKEGAGLSWQETCLVDSNTLQMEHEVTEWEAEKKTVVQTQLPMGASMNRTTEFKKVAEGTEVNVRLEWNLGLMGTFVGEDKMLQMMEKSFSKTAGKWKEKAETK